MEQEDARVCREISEAACHELPGNFFRLTAAQTLTSLGDEPVNAKTVLSWLMAALAVATVREDAGETGGGGNALVEAIRRLDVLRTHAPFRRFTLVRALLVSTGLMAPWLVALAGDSGVATRGLFVFASGLAASVSDTVWGRWADVSSRRVLAVAAGGASGIGVLVWLLAVSGVAAQAGMFVYPLAFFALADAHSGVRVGCRTCVVDMAEGNRRTDHVAVGNTVIGVVLLLVGALMSLPLGLAAEQMVLARSR